MLGGVNRRLLDSFKTSKLRVMKSRPVKSRKPWLIIGAATALASALLACYPSPDLGIQDFDTVITVRTEGVDFGEFSTYAVPDTVISRPDSSRVSKELTDLIVGDIHRNMTQLGYQLEPDPANNPPDVVVIAGAITEDQYGAWLGYPFMGGWQWYVGGSIGYSPVNVVYQYSLGTVTMDMVDYRDVPPDSASYSAVWTAAISGPLQRNVDNRAQRITDGIDRAFEQSPYLIPR